MKNTKCFLLSFLLIIVPLLHIYPQEINNQLLKHIVQPYRNYNPGYTNGDNSLSNIYKFIDLKSIAVGKSSSGLIDSVICLSRDNKSKVTYDYDNYGRISSCIWASPDQNQWLNIGRKTITYDSAGNTISELSEGWWTDHWKVNSRKTYSFDSNNKLLSTLYELANNALWVNDNLTNYQYNNYGSLETTQSLIWYNNGWVNNTKLTTHYNVDGDADSVLSELWIGGKWNNDGMWTLSYENNKSSVFYYTKIWQNDNWVTSSKVNYQYDLNGNLVYGLTQEWDGSQWINSRRFNYYYNGNNNFEHGLNETYLNGMWTPADFYFIITNPDLHLTISTAEVTIYYKITSVREKQTIANGYMLSQNYPNPFNPSTTIKYQLPESGLVSLKIYNILGKEVATLVNDNMREGLYEVSFNASKLVSGVYIYQLKVNDYLSSKKMILVK